MRSRRLVLVPILAAALLAGGAGSAMARGRPFSSWLREVNRYRVQNGLAPVVSQPLWVAGIAQHLNYLHRTPRSYLTGAYASMHTENPASPYYTPGGDREARSSDIGGGDTPVDAIDNWWAAPFHAIAILRPQLRQVAFARDRHRRAALDVIQGLDRGAPLSPRPILFPPAGSRVSFIWLPDEHPDPRVTCGWKGRAGLPLIVMLPSVPSPALSATLTRGHGRPARTGRGLCLVDRWTYRPSDPVYGPNGAQTLANDNAVILLPRHPLRDGRFTARVHQANLPDVAWSFTVHAPVGGVRRHRRATSTRHGLISIASAHCSDSHRCFATAKLTARIGRHRRPVTVARSSWIIGPGRTRTLRSYMTRRGFYALYYRHRYTATARVRLTGWQRHGMTRSFRIALRWPGR